MRRYKPIILTCEHCGNKHEEVRTSMLIRVKTPIIETAYLNKWTNLCGECIQKISSEIEQRLSDWTITKENGE